MFGKKKPALRRIRMTATPRPLRHSLAAAAFEEFPIRAADGLRIGLTRVDTGKSARPAVLLLHGHTASADMFPWPRRSAT